MSVYGEDDNITAYWERNYQIWQAAPEWGTFTAKQAWFRERFEHLLPPPAGLKSAWPVGSVLDYGCGNAMYAVPLLERFESYQGFDTSRTATQIAASWYHRERPDLVDRMEIDFYYGEPGYYAERHPWLKAKFDLVMSITVLQHQPLAQRLHMIDDIKKMLKPRGMYLGLEWIGGTQAYDMPPMSEEVWRAAWHPWVLTFDVPPEHPDWAANNVWTARLPDDDQRPADLSRTERIQPPEEPAPVDPARGPGPVGGESARQV